MAKTGVIYGINGPVVSLAGDPGFQMNEMVYVGMEFDLDKNWSLNFDIKYQLISDLDQAVFNLGVAYNF